MVVSGAFVVGLVADSEDDFSDGFVGSAFATSCDVVSEVSSSTFPSNDWEAASSVSSWFSPAALDSFGIDSGIKCTIHQWLVFASRLTAGSPYSFTKESTTTF